jgi:hypothetical protein
MDWRLAAISYCRRVFAHPEILYKQTLYSDAYQLLGFKKHATFEELATRLGVA